MTLEDFKQADQHTDISFFNLDATAQMIANEIMVMFDDYNSVKRAVDRSPGFRKAVRSSKVYMAETDSVMRYWLYLQDNKKDNENERC